MLILIKYSKVNKKGGVKDIDFLLIIFVFIVDVSSDEMLCDGVVFLTVFSLDFSTSHIPKALVFFKSSTTL